jgi:FkbM family methyltransferase
LYPLYSGCGKIANSPWFRQISPDLIVETQIRDGSSIWVDLGDFIGRSIYYFGDFDPKITWICQRVLRPGDTMLDVGANFGLVSLYCAKLVGRSGTIHAFEPQPQLAQLFQQSIEKNQYSQIALHEIALSNTDGTMTLSIPSDNSGAASLTFSFTDERAIQVPVRNASDYLGNLNLAQVRLLKLDVEGHEKEVLQGAYQFLKEQPVDVILFEEHKKPATEQESIQLLQNLQYEIWEIPQIKFSMKLSKIEPQHSGSKGSHDYVAIGTGPAYRGIVTALNLPID